MVMIDAVECRCQVCVEYPSPLRVLPAYGVEDGLDRVVAATARTKAIGVGWAARRGPVFMLDEPGPFPGSLPPNRTCTFSCIRLSSYLCRVRDGVRVDPVMARCADDERLAPHFRHEGGPRGLARSRFPEVLESGDLVDCHRGAGLAEFALPFAEPSGQLLAGVEGRAGRGG